MPKTKLSSSVSSTVRTAARFDAAQFELLSFSVPFGRSIPGIKQPRPQTTPVSTTADIAAKSSRIVALPPRPRTCPPRISSLAVWNNVKDGIKDVPLIKQSPKVVPDKATLPIHQRASTSNSKPQTNNTDEAIRKSEIPSTRPASTHADHCAGTKPKKLFTSTPPFLISSDLVVKDKKLFLRNVLEAKQKRTRMPVGKTNIRDVVDLSNRGTIYSSHIPGTNWWWKDPQWPVLEDDDNIIKSQVLWPSNKARQGMGLRNIECSTGLTGAGVAGDERIVGPDGSQGIRRKNMDGMVTPMEPTSKSSIDSLAGSRRVSRQQLSPSEEREKTFYQALTYEGSGSQNMPIRHDIFAKKEERAIRQGSLKGGKPYLHSNYDTLQEFSPKQTSTYYSSEQERFDPKIFYTRNAREESIKAARQEVKLEGMRKMLTPTSI
jgi:hypothetical protein